MNSPSPKGVATKWAHSQRMLEDTNVTGSFDHTFLGTLMLRVYCTVGTAVTPSTELLPSWRLLSTTRETITEARTILWKGKAMVGKAGFPGGSLSWKYPGEGQERYCQK